jgi:hypothetical protein
LQKILDNPLSPPHLTQKCPTQEKKVKRYLSQKIENLLSLPPLPQTEMFTSTQNKGGKKKLRVRKVAYSQLFQILCDRMTPRVADTTPSWDYCLASSPNFKCLEQLLVEGIFLEARHIQQDIVTPVLHLFELYCLFLVLTKHRQLITGHNQQAM